MPSFLKGFDMDDQPVEVMLRGQGVGTDGAGNVCLNDLWRLSGSPDAKRPSDWQNSQRAKNLREALVKRIAENLGKSTKDVDKTVYYVVGRGRPARTFAHFVLALDYSEYLNPDLGVEVRETFMRVRARDVTLALEIMEGMSAQTEYDELRVKLRKLVKDHNKLSAGVAQDAGVKNFEAYNGAGLAGLYGDMTKADLLKKKGLPEDADRLAHAGHEELAANYFKATQAIAKLQRDKIKGQKAANDAHYEVGAAVRATIKGLGGTMPEDEPALEHIKEAEKRLKKAEKAQKDRLIEAAKEHGASESEADFDEALKAIPTAKPNPTKRPK